MKISEKDGWLINPWPDSAFLIFLPAVFIILFLVSPLNARLFKISIMSYDKIILYLLEAHFMGTMGMVYLNRNEFRKKILSYVWLPLMLVCAYTILRLMRFNNQLYSVIFYAIILHEIFQYCYISSICHFSRARSSAIDAVISGIPLVLVPAYCMLQSFSYFTYHYYSAPVFSLRTGHYILSGVKLLALCAIAVFAGRQIYVYIKRKKISWFAILMTFTICFIYYFPAIVFKKKELLQSVTLRLHHAVQYLTWLFFYFGLKFKGHIIEGAEFFSGLFLPCKGVFFFIFLLALPMVRQSVFKAITPFTHETIFEELWFGNCAVLHIYLDVVFWRDMRKRGGEIMQ